MTITYEYEDALYVNLTNKCNCNCEFCLRHGRKEGSIYTEDSLWLEREPTRYVPHVVLTIVDKDKSSEEIETCRQIAAELGVKLRIRSFIDS